MENNLLPVGKMELQTVCRFIHFASLVVAKRPNAQIKTHINCETNNFAVPLRDRKGIKCDCGCAKVGGGKEM